MKKKFKKIYIEITNICNLNCKFCPETNRVKKTISTQDFETIISKIHNYTDIVYLHVKGEPLLHNNLKEILDIISKYNIKTNITTNGILLKNKLDIIKNTNSINQLNISLHSITQNENINHKEYLNKIFESTKELHNIKISYRLWNLKTLNKNDINDLIICELKKYYKLNDLKNKLTENQSIKIAENIYINQDTEFTWPDINAKPIITQGRCLALKDQIAILVDGTVVPCCLDNNGNIKLGNILSESLEDILSSPTAQKIKKNFENNIITCDLCKTCGFLKRLESKRKSTLNK